MNRIFSMFTLLIVVFIWGISFVWQSVASKSLDAFTVVGVRSLFAVIVLTTISLIIPSIYKSQNPKIKLKKYTLSYNIFLSILCGIVLFTAMSVQQFGITYTTASKSGFITVLYICFVPLIGLLLFKRKVNTFFLIGLTFSVIGLYLLSIKGNFTLEYGDLIVLISSFFLAIHITLIDYVSVRVNTIFISIVQMSVVSTICLTISFFKNTLNIETICQVLPELLALGVFSSAIAFTLQIVAQREIPANTASLMMSLESVFAVIGGVFILGEVLSTREITGMILLLIGIVVSQRKTEERIKIYDGEKNN